MSSESLHPISIHIPVELSHFAIPPQQFLQKSSNFDNLAVGAFIFSAPDRNSASPARLLLVQRAAAEKAFPHCWEVPGGKAELTDPTVLHSVAREVFEETGLHLTRLVRTIGDGVSFQGGGTDRWFKLSFEIRVAEMDGCYPALNVLVNENNSGKEGKNAGLATKESAIPPSISICLDPTEHQDFRWITEEEVKGSEEHENTLQLVSDDQKSVILEAFRLHSRG